MHFLKSFFNRFLKVQASASIQDDDKLVIPDGTQDIPERAYASSEYITVIIPYGVKSIGREAFIGCEMLESITIPDSVTSIADDAFTGCESLSNINLGPQSHFVFEDKALLYSRDKTTLIKCLPANAPHHVVLPLELQTICAAAFDDCVDLRSIAIPEGVTTIGPRAFADCFCLESITLPDSLQTIQPMTFLGCASLLSITIPQSVTTIGLDAFTDTMLSEIKILNKSCDYSLADIPPAAKIII